MLESLLFTNPYYSYHRLQVAGAVIIIWLME